MIGWHGIKIKSREYDDHTKQKRYAAESYESPEALEQRLIYEKKTREIRAKAKLEKKKASGLHGGVEK